MDFRLQRIWPTVCHWPFCWRANFAVLFVGYGILVLVLHGSALDNNWSYDDTQILKHALAYSPWLYFTDPSAWRALVPFNLTPWLSLQFYADAYVFGLQPLGFYLHALTLLTGSVVLMHVLVKTWVGNFGGVVAAVLMLLGAPTMVAAQQLMVRHYVEGLFFLLLGIWFFLQALKLTSAAYWLSGLSALCFCIAVSAKELYVPMAVLPLLIPMATWHQRLRYGWSWLLVLAVYVPWRFYMLGSLSGGYTPPSALMTQGWDKALTAFAGVPELLMPWWAWAGATALLTGGWIAWGTTRCRASVLMWLTLPVLLLMPLIPLAMGGTLGEERFLIAVWAAVSIGLGGCAALLARHGKRGLLIAGVLTTAVCTGSLAYSQKTMAKMAPVQAQYFALAQILLKNSAEPAAVWVAPELLPHFALGLVDLRKVQHESAADVHLISDEVELASLPELMPVLRFNPRSGLWEDIQDSVADELTQWRSRLRSEPLDVQLVYDSTSRTLTVRLQSPAGGRYFHVGSGARTEIPAELVIRAESMSKQCFLIRHDTANGTMIYSPWLYLKEQGDGRFFRAEWAGLGLLNPGTQPDCERAQ